MRIIKLGTVTLLASNVAASTYDEYDDVESYDTGDKVVVSYESDGETPRFPVIEYESLADANVGNYPPDDPENWIEIGAENRCKMFDAYTNTQTELAGDDMEVSVGANGFDTVGLFGLYGTEVTLRLVHGDGEAAVTKKEEAIDLRTMMPESGYYNWLYGSYEYGVSQIIWNFPRYAADAVLEIEITQRSSAAACGMVVLGNQRTLGITRYGVKIGIDDYSLKDTDFLGRTYLNQGNYADRGDIEMWIQNTKIDFVKRQLTSVRGAACIFDLNNPGVGYQALSIYGFPQNFDIIIPGPIRSKCNLEIKGLI